MSAKNQIPEPDSMKAPAPEQWKSQCLVARVQRDEALDLLRQIAREGEFMDREALRLIVAGWLARRCNSEESLISKPIQPPRNPMPHYAPPRCACSQKGWENKWRIAVEMAAQAMVERDEWREKAQRMQTACDKWSDTSALPIPVAIYPCQNCYEEYSYPADELRWSAETSGWVCWDCWQDDAHGVAAHAVRLDAEIMRQHSLISKPVGISTQ